MDRGLPEVEPQEHKACRKTHGTSTLVAQRDLQYVCFDKLDPLPPTESGTELLLVIEVGVPVILVGTSDAVAVGVLAESTFASRFRRRVIENVRMPMLNLEHIACNVADPAAMAAWYVEHLGMRVVRQSQDPSRIHFLADAAGRAVIEIYRNAADAIPDYAAMNPLRFHIAFAAADPDGARAALIAAGATFVDERTLPDGSRLLMLRDPWGIPLQLCKRATPLLA